MENIILYLNKIGEHFAAFSEAMLIQSGVLIVLLLVIDWLIRKRVRAVFRYCIWMLVFVKLLLPPSLCLPTGVGYWCGWEQAKTESTAPLAELTEPLTEQGLPQPPLTLNPQPVVVQENAVADEGTYVPPQPEVLPVVAVPLPSLTWQAFVFLGWLVGVLVLSVVLVQRFLFVKSLVAQSEIAEGAALETLEVCRKQVGLNRPVQLRLTANMLSPAACGLRNPVVLMPAALLDKLTDEKLKAVLIHELAHIKRGDLWVNFMQTLLQIVYFYNPLLWVANAVVRGIREKAVDEMVLTKLGDEAGSYSTTLIDIAEIAFSRPHFSLRLVGVVESKKALTGRIKHILSRPFPKSAKISLVGLAAVFLTAVVLLPMAKGSSAKDTNNWTKPTEKWKVKPIKKTSLESFFGGWKNLPFEISTDEEQVVDRCAKLLIQWHKWYNVDADHADQIRKELESVLLERPEFFYAEYLLGIWHRDYGDKELSEELIKKAYEHAPVILVQKYQDENGDPTTELEIRHYEIECNRVKKGSLNPDLILKFRDLITDDDGCIYVPVYDTVYRLHAASLPNGHNITYPKLGWFKARSKVALMPTAVNEKVGSEVIKKESDYTATLPNGVTVELLGVCEHPSDGKQWWMPNGSVLETRPYEVFKHHAYPDAGEQAREMAIQLRGDQELVNWASITWKIPNSSSGSGHIGDRDEQGQQILTTYGIAFTCDSGLKDLDFQLGIAAGDWKDQAFSSGSGFTNMSDGDLSVGFAPPMPVEGKTRITVSWKTVERDFRVVAIDKDKHLHTSTRSTGGRSGDLSSNTYTFEIPPDQIETYKLQSRNYEWVTFKNISLRPGGETEVQVQSSVSSSQSSGKEAQGTSNVDVEPFVGVWELVDIKGQNPMKLKTATLRILPDGAVFAEGVDTDDQFTANNGQFSDIASDCYLENGQLIVTSQDTKAVFKKIKSPDSKTNVETETETTNSELETNNYTATLPNGVTVELLGVCEYPSVGKQWYSPDGIPISLPDGLKIDDNISRTDENAYQFLFRYNSKKDIVWNSVEAVFLHFSVKGASPLEFINYRRYPTKDQDGLIAKVAIFKEPQDSTLVQANLAMGDWTTNAIRDISKIDQRDEDYYWIETSSASYRNLLILHQIEGRQIKTISIDNEGNQYNKSYSRGSFGGWTSISNTPINGERRYTAQITKDDRLAKFQLQSRPFISTILGNVSLRPGRKAEVQIQSSGEQAATGAGTVSAKTGSIGKINLPVGTVGKVVYEHGDAIYGSEKEYSSLMYLGRVKQGQKIELIETDVYYNQFSVPIVKVKAQSSSWAAVSKGTTGWIQLNITDFAGAFEQKPDDQLPRHFKELKKERFEIAMEEYRKRYPGKIKTQSSVSSPSASGEKSDNLLLGQILNKVITNTALPSKGKAVYKLEESDEEEKSRILRCKYIFDESLYLFATETLQEGKGLGALDVVNIFDGEKSTLWYPKEKKADFQKGRHNPPIYRLGRFMPYETLNKLLKHNTEIKGHDKFNNINCLLLHCVVSVNETIDVWMAEKPEIFPLKLEHYKSGNLKFLYEFEDIRSRNGQLFPWKIKYTNYYKYNNAGKAEGVSRKVVTLEEFHPEIEIDRSEFVPDYPQGTSVWNRNTDKHELILSSTAESDQESTEQTQAENVSLHPGGEADAEK